MTGSTHVIKKKCKHIRRVAQYGVLYFFLRVLQTIAKYMPESWVFFFCERLALGIFYLAGKERKKTITHLNTAFAEEKSAEEIFSIARETFVNLGRNFAELLRWDLYTADLMRERITCTDGHYLRDALKAGNGALAITGHCGNFELIPPYTVLVDKIESGVIARAFHDDRLNRMLVNLRESKQYKVFDRDDSPRRILTFLRKNHVLGILADQDIRKLDGVFIRFFGHQAYTPVAPVKIAQAARCPLIPVLITRDPDDKYRHHIRFYPPIKLIDRKADPNSTVINTQRWSDVIENHIRNYPSQWVWMHNRWKTTPDKLQRRSP